MAEGRIELCLRESVFRGILANGREKRGGSFLIRLLQATFRIAGSCPYLQECPTFGELFKSTMCAILMDKLKYLAALIHERNFHRHQSC